MDCVNCHRQGHQCKAQTEDDSGHPVCAFCIDGEPCPIAKRNGAKPVPEKSESCRYCGNPRHRGRCAEMRAALKGEKPKAKVETQIEEQRVNISLKASQLDAYWNRLSTSDKAAMLQWLLDKED